MFWLGLTQSARREETSLCLVAFKQLGPSLFITAHINDTERIEEGSILFLDSPN